ncbi:hypothetical protein [Mammaliicoccus sciuri]|uniref:hypothetical protein n=1 Tax=Mammaliicoccus sciuri TaxID=1296 RepID=UPI003CF34DEE
MGNKFDELLEQFGSYNGTLNDTALVDKIYLDELKAKAKAFNKISDVIKRAELYDRDTALDVIEIVDELEDK